MNTLGSSIRIAMGGLIVAGALALAAGTAAGATTTSFHATFHDNGSLTTCAPTAVFCGSGVLDGFGPATTEVHPTSVVPAGDCLIATGTRSITLNDGSGSLAMTFTGTRCPLGGQGGGDRARILFGWTIVSGTGTLTGATGSGSGVNTTAGRVQVVTMTGTINLP